MVGAFPGGSVGKTLSSDGGGTGLTPAGELRSCILQATWQGQKEGKKNPSKCIVVLNCGVGKDS